MIILRVNEFANLLKILAALIIFLFISVVQPQTVWSKAYRPQNPEAAIGPVKISLIGPDSFPRIDGQDRNLDDILLATQSPAAAILGIFAEPGAWKKFQSAKKSEDTGLNCHALISTPAPMADRNTTPDDFSRIKKDLNSNLKGSVNKERRLEGELATVSDHKVEQAVGRIEAFAVLDEGKDFIIYRLESSLEIRFKDKSKPRISRSTTITSTMLLEGKIINLQLIADAQGPSRKTLEKTAISWHESFIKANLRNR